MAIQWNTETEVPKSSTKSSSGIKWDSFDQSQAALSHSQKLVDMQAESQRAEQAAQLAAKPAAIAKETAKGTLSSLADKGLKFIGSALQAPTDLANQFMGKATNADAKIFGFGGPQKTIQGEFSSDTLPKVDSGEISPLGATASAVGQTVSGAADVVGGEGLLSGAKNLLKKPVAAVSSALKSYAEKRADQKATDASINAVYNSPTGAKFKKTSGQILTGQRNITPASAFREQGLNPDQQTVNLGTRLKDIGLGKDPVQNTEKLSNAFTETEAKLQTALKGDPSLVYSADRENLVRKLNTVRTEAPQEFRIKGSSELVDSVVNFANRLVGKSEDTLGAIRDTRIAFDTQAKREFPNAFKPDGTIDTKTPAGYAIKKVRDDINEHLYNTAPNGSEIQGLIGREADLYRAAQVAVEKASKGEGKNALAQWIKANPQKAKVLEAAGLITVGGLGVSLLKGD